MTKKQKKQIHKIIIGAWDKIYSDVLTDKDKDKKGLVNKNICFEMEDMFKGFAAEFGLGGFGE